MSKMILVLVGVLVLSGTALGATTPPSAAATRTEVQAALKAYVDAANRADVSTMMEMVSRKEGVISVGDGEIAVAVTPYTFTIASDKGTVQVPGAVSFVFEKSGGKWLVVHEHSSIKMQEAAAQGE